MQCVLFFFSHHDVRWDSHVLTMNWSSNWGAALHFTWPLWWWALKRPSPAGHGTAQHRDPWLFNGGFQGKGLKTRLHLASVCFLQPERMNTYACEFTCMTEATWASQYFTAGVWYLWTDREMEGDITLRFLQLLHVDLAYFHSQLMLNGALKQNQLPVTPSFLHF